MKLFLAPLLGLVLGGLIVTVSYLVPVRRFYFGGTGSTVYGFPFIFREHWSLDLIGSGTNYYPFNIVLDFAFWVLIISGILIAREIGRRRTRRTSFGPPSLSFK